MQPLTMRRKKASDEVPPDAASDRPPLWEWMQSYAKFQFAAQTLREAYKEEATHAIDEKCFLTCENTLKALDSAAPLGDLAYCQTKEGATLQAVVHTLNSYFESRCR